MIRYCVRYFDAIQYKKFKTGKKNPERFSKFAS